MGQNSKPISGVLEIRAGGGGHLRDPKSGYLVRPQDPTVPARLCERFGLRGGETVVGEGKPRGGKGGSNSPELSSIETINDKPADEYIETKPFEELTAIDPREQLRFETPGGPTTMRVIDLMTPIGLGQRGLIVAAPRTGKTILLQQMAHGIAENFPQAHLMMLLVDERPEEVTDMRRRVRGEVVASSSDHDAQRHVRLARMVTAKAKRLVECGEHVVLLLDSLTRLGRAFNKTVRASGRIMSGGLDIGALTEPKSIFGAARNVEGGGSLTTIASALIETGSRMDDVIFNEFKGTGNMEIMLSQELSNLRIWPAIDLQQSGTRKEEFLLTPEALEASHAIRKTLVQRSPVRAMESLLKALDKHESNDAFIAQFSENKLR